MVRFFSFFIAVFIIIGCSKNITIDQLDMQKVQELSMTNTREGELSNQNSKIFILATYLNPTKISEIDDGKENFLICVYVSRQKDNAKSDNNPFYKVFLNDTVLSTNVKRVSEKSKILKIIPIKNRWSKYYLLSFAKQKTKKLKLTFENREHKRVNLIFSKEL